MTYTVTLVTSDYRGDHAADVSVAVDVRTGETVADLVARLLGGARQGVGNDRIELRVVQVIGTPPDRDPWAAPPPSTEPPF